MTDLPLITFLDSDRTAGELKTSFYGPQLDVLAEQPGGAAEQSLTVASGAVTPAAQASRAIKLAGEGAADDDLDNVALTNVPTGAEVILRGNGTDVITLKHGAGGSGQMLLRDAVDYVLDTDEKRVAFMVVGTDLLEIWRSHAHVPPVRAEIATTSGSTSEFTSITANAKRITGFLDGVSSDGTLDWLIQLGDATAYVTSGYQGGSFAQVTAQANPNNQSFSSGFVINDSVVAADVYHGHFILELIDAANNVWNYRARLIESSGGLIQVVGDGRLAMSGPLTRLRLNVQTDALDAGAWTVRVEE